MAVEWSTRYRPRSRTGYYTRNIPDDPLGTWATDQISLFYDALLRVFERERELTRADVTARARVDTGFMRAQVDSYLAHTKTEIRLEFGWEFGRPLYAIFQEFGTRTGIKPMQAVHHAFHGSVARIKTELGR